MDAGEIHLNRARQLMQLSRFEQAEEQLHLALAENSGDGTAHALLALCLCERKQFDAATEEAQQAIHHEPDNAFGFFALATVLEDRNRLTDAARAIDEAIRLQPWNELYFGRLASIRFHQSQWEQSLAAAEQGLQFDPDDVTCTNLRAMALTKLGRRDEAGATIGTALANDPDNAWSHANMGWTLLHGRQPEQAMHHFREALRLEPNLEWARIGIIEAMKARHAVYRWMLAWFLWLGRLPPKIQIALVLGLLFGNQILTTITSRVPALAPATPWIAGGYALFVWMNWTSSTLFNVVLLTNRFGRLALNRREKLGAVLAGGCILACLGVGTVATIADGTGLTVEETWLTSLLYLGLAIPVSAATFLPRPRALLMGAYSFGLAIVLVIATTMLFHLIGGIQELAAQFQLQGMVDDVAKRHFTVTYVEPFVTWSRYGLNGIVLSTWIGMFAAAAPERR